MLRYACTAVNKLTWMERVLGVEQCCEMIKSKADLWEALRRRFCFAA